MTLLSDILKPKSEEEIRKNIDKIFLTPYHVHGILASPHCDLNKFKYIIEHPLFDPNFNEGYLFHMMCSLNEIDKVYLLLQNEKLDPSLINNRSIKIAHAMDFREIIDMLLKNKKVIKKIARKEIKKYRKPYVTYSNLSS